MLQLPEGSRQARACDCTPSAGSGTQLMKASVSTAAADKTTEGEPAGMVVVVVVVVVGIVVTIGFVVTAGDSSSEVVDVTVWSATLS